MGIYHGLTSGVFSNVIPKVKSFLLSTVTTPSPQKKKELMMMMINKRINNDSL